jgi:hypothetical protein
MPLRLRGVRKCNITKIKTNYLFGMINQLRIAAPIILGGCVSLVALPAHAEWKLIDTWKDIQRLYIELPAKPSNRGKKQLLVRLLTDESYPQYSFYRRNGILSVVTTYLVDCAVGAESSYQFYYYPGKMAQGKGNYDSGKSLIKAKQELSRPWQGSTIDNMIQLACKSVGFQAPKGKTYPKPTVP